MHRGGKLQQPIEFLSDKTGFIRIGTANDDARRGGQRALAKMVIDRALDPRF